MKNLLLLAALICFGGSAQAAPPRPYVAVFRVTPGAAPTKILAFQNTSTGQSVIVDRIEIANASTMTVTGGQAQYWVWGSTQVEHSVAAGKHYAYASALASAPTAITASTAPINVLFEGDSAALVGGNIVTALPLIRPLVVDSDDAATVNRADAWDSSEGRQAVAEPLVLPADSSRALVIEKRMGAASDFTAGSVIIRIFYWLR